MPEHLFLIHIHLKNYDNNNSDNIISYTKKKKKRPEHLILINIELNQKIIDNRDWPKNYFCAMREAQGKIAKS